MGFEVEYETFPSAGGGSVDTIYSADGALSEERTLDGAGNTLNLVSLDGFNVQAVGAIELLGESGVNIQANGEIVINNADEGFSYYFREALYLSNDGTGGMVAGSINLNNGLHQVSVQPGGGLTASRIVTFPDASGVLALQSDISNIYTSNGVLSGSRNINANGNALSISNPDSFIVSGTSAELNFSMDSGFTAGGVLTEFLTGSELYFDDGASGGGRQSILLSGVAFGFGMIVTDSAQFKGLEYAADYSAQFTARSLVDKGYVDSVAAPVAQSIDLLFYGPSTDGNGEINISFADGVASNSDASLSIARVGFTGNVTMSFSSPVAGLTLNIGSFSTSSTGNVTFFGGTIVSKCGFAQGEFQYDGSANAPGTYVGVITLTNGTVTTYVRVEIEIT